MNVFRDLYQYRELLKTNIKKTLEAVIKALFWEFFGHFKSAIASSRILFCVSLFNAGAIPNYMVYLITGMIPWNFFS